MIHLPGIRNAWQATKAAPGLACLLSLFLATASASLAAEPAPPQFGPPTNFPTGNLLPTGNLPGSMLIVDLDQDGLPDAVVSRSSYTTVLKGLGAGALNAPVDFPRSAGMGASLAAGDFNNDRKTDIVCMPHASSFGFVLLGDGRGGFTAARNTSFYPDDSAPGVGVADFDLDGNTDIAVLFYSSIRVASGIGDGSFARPSIYGLTNNTAGACLKVADVHGNGKPSLVVSLTTWTPAISNCFCVLSNAGNGAFASPVYYKASRGERHPALEMGNFTTDSAPDAAVLNYYSNSVTIWTNSGRGVFSPSREYALGFAPTAITQADANQDGPTDLLIRGGGGAAMLLGDGKGSFEVLPLSLPEDTCASGDTAGFANFSGKGTPDLAILNCSGASVALLLNQTPPTLRLTPFREYIQLDWPGNLGTGFSLEYTTNLSAPGSWQPFPYPPTEIGDRKGATDWSSAPQKFYRLSR